MRAVGAHDMCKDRIETPLLLQKWAPQRLPLHSPQSGSTILVPAAAGQIDCPVEPDLDQNIDIFPFQPLAVPNGILH